MAKYKVVVWATVGGCTSKEVIDIETDIPPTYEEMDDIFRDYIGNILDSGTYFIIDGEEI